MIRAGFGNVLQGNVPGRKWVRVGIGRADNRVDKESLYGQRDKPGDVIRCRDSWSRKTGRIARQTGRGKADQ